MQILAWLEPNKRGLRIAHIANLVSKAPRSTWCHGRDQRPLPPLLLPCRARAELPSARALLRKEAPSGAAGHIFSKIEKLFLGGGPNGDFSSWGVSSSGPTTRSDHFLDALLSGTSEFFVARRRKPSQLARRRLRTPGFRPPLIFLLEIPFC